MAKNWEDLSAQGMKFLNLGQDDLLHFRHAQAKEHFAIAANNFYKASQVASGNAKKNEMAFNAAIAHFHGGNYTRAYEYLSVCNYHKKVPAELEDTYKELAALIKDRRKDAYWDTVRSDVYSLRKEQKWDALLDLLRSCP